jgi:thymidine kinase
MNNWLVMSENRANGRIEVLIGPMFSGKTAQLILRVTQAQAIGRKVQVFKPRLDTRGLSHEVQSCTGLHIEAMPVGDATDILKLLDPNTNVVALDEAQFFEPSVVNVCRALADQGKRVIVAGLDMDFRGEPFGPTPQLLAVAEVVHKLTALCTVCGEPASFTQRLVNGKPAGFSDPVVLVGDRDLYEPRCRLHHLIPEKEASAVSGMNKGCKNEKARSRANCC